MTDQKPNQYNLRPVHENDCDILLNMRNADFVRDSMINSKIIESNEHKTWFSNMLLDNSKEFFIFEIDDRIEGAIGFFEITEEEANWTFYLKENLFKKGRATKMCSMALNLFFQNYESRRIKTYVKSNNLPSIKIHKKLGFIENFNNFKETDQLSCFVLEKKGWIAFCKNLD